jgi:hypothetical protein
VYRCIGRAGGGSNPKNATRYDGPVALNHGQSSQEEDPEIRGTLSPSPYSSPPYYARDVG